MKSPFRMFFINFFRSIVKHIFFQQNSIWQRYVSLNVELPKWEQISANVNPVTRSTSETVTYLAKDYKNGGKMIPYTVKGTEFLRLFLMHVLPKGFVRIRHYGILSCRSKKDKMDLCRKLLNCTQYLSKLRNKTVAEKLQILYQKDICKCEKCGGKLLSFRLRGSYSLTG